MRFSGVQAISGAAICMREATSNRRYSLGPCSFHELVVDEWHKGRKTCTNNANVHFQVCNYGEWKAVPCFNVSEVNV